MAMKKADRTLIEARNNFSNFGADPDIEEVEADGTFRYLFKGEEFVTLKRDGDRFTVELLIPAERKDWVKSVKSKRFEYVPMKGKGRKGWYSVELGPDVKDWLEAEVEATVGAMEKELKGK